MSATPAERALCCGPTCHFGSTDGSGPCAAAIYGRAIARRAWLAGFVVVPAEASHTLPSSSQTRPVDAVTHAEVERLRLAGASLLLEARYMAQQLSHRGLPGVKKDSVDRAIEGMRAALAREAPDA